MSLINATGLGKTYGSRRLLSGIDLVLAKGDRLGIIGPNGAGKTTLLRILAGAEQPDEGVVIRRRGLRVGYVPQEDALDPEASVLETVLDAARLAADPSRVETEIEREVRVRIVLGRVGFDDPEQRTGTLSGGWKKRVSIAAALAGDPEVLLLDEPTNHLDLAGILWLEKLLVSSRLTLAVISHDRAFLQQVATRMLEVAPHYPGGVLAVTGAYREFLEQRETFLATRAQQRESLANRVRRELEWLSRGPKARTTKSQARIEQAERLRGELATLDAQHPADAIGLELVGSGRATRQLLLATGLGASLGGRRLFGGLDLLLRPGLRLGVVGANGSGKSTLLRILAGEREPDEGTARRAQNLQVVYFDQGREQLDPAQPLRRALAGPSDSVIYRETQLHVISWAKRFGFRAEQLDLPIGELSGGEQARVHIARVMLRPADLLLLDEPTNDLDIPTLEVLEDSLLEFPGALVLVTHDRMLLDTVCGALLGLDGRGGATPFADSDQWQRAIAAPQTERGSPRMVQAGRPAPVRRSGLSYREKQEYEGMEAVILAAEDELAGAAAHLADPVVATDGARAQQAFEAHLQAQERVDALYRRWAELETRAKSGESS